MTSEQNEIGHYDYEDHRTVEERKSKLWVTVSEDKEQDFQRVGTRFGRSKQTKNGGNFGNKYKKRTKKNAL